MNIQDWSPLGWTSWISLLSKGLCQESSPTPQFFYHVYYFYFSKWTNMFFKGDDADTDN